MITYYISRFFGKLCNLAVKVKAERTAHLLNKIENKFMCLVR